MLRNSIDYIKKDIEILKENDTIALKNAEELIKTLPIFIL